MYNLKQFIKKINLPPHPSPSATVLPHALQNTVNLFSGVSGSHCPGWHQMPQGVKTGTGPRRRGSHVGCRRPSEGLELSMGAANPQFQDPEAQSPPTLILPKISLLPPGSGWRRWSPGLPAECWSRFFLLWGLESRGLLMSLSEHPSYSPPL